MNLIGATCGRLKVTRRANVYSKRRKCPYWECVCGCGETKIIRGSNITARSQLSCGCLKGYHDTKHGKSYAARSLALYFLRDHIESTLEFTDSIHADRLSFDVCEFAAGFPGTSTVDYPDIYDLIAVMGVFNQELADMHHQLYGLYLPEDMNFEIYGIKYK